VEVAAALAVLPNLVIFIITRCSHFIGLTVAVAEGLLRAPAVPVGVLLIALRVQPPPPAALGLLVIVAILAIQTVYPVTLVTLELLGLLEPQPLDFL